GDERENEYRRETAKLVLPLLWSSHHLLHLPFRFPWSLHWTRIVDWLRPAVTRCWAPRLRASRVRSRPARTHASRPLRRAAASKRGCRRRGRPCHGGGGGSRCGRGSVSAGAPRRPP